MHHSTKNTQNIINDGQAPPYESSDPLPVALHNVPSIVQSLGGQQNCPGVCDLEEVLGASHERALVPSGLLDVDVGGQLSSHGCFSLLWAET